MVSRIFFHVIIQYMKARLSEGGRLVIPAEFRRALGVRPGDEVILRLEEGELRVLTLERAIRRAQELVAHYVPKGVSLAAELLEERRMEAAAEFGRSAPIAK